MKNTNTKKPRKKKDFFERFGIPHFDMAALERDVEADDELDDGEPAMRSCPYCGSANVTFDGPGRLHCYHCGRDYNAI